MEMGYIIEIKTKDNKVGYLASDASSGYPYISSHPLSQVFMNLSNALLCIKSSIPLIREIESINLNKIEVTSCVNIDLASKFDKKVYFDMKSGTAHDVVVIGVPDEFGVVVVVTSGDVIKEVNQDTLFDKV